MTRHELLQLLEGYLDAVPRPSSRVEPFGSLTLFARLENGWPYYARPTLGGGAVSLRDLQAVRARQRQLNVPEALEWVDEVTPSLRPVVKQAGMAYEALPLMVLREPMKAAEPAGAHVRMVSPDDPLLAMATAVANVGFATPGTDIGTTGIAERDENAGRMTPERLDFLRSRMSGGLTMTAVAIDDQLGPMSVGSHQPVDGVTEIVGVATLPAARRCGYGAAVTARLVADARERGVTTIFLSAGSDDVARMYARLGFERVGTSCIAEVGQG